MSQIAELQSRTYYGLIGNSKPIVELREHIERAAPTYVPVLIVGERGTEVYKVARTLHELSRYERGKFIEFSAQGLLEEKIRYELFGANDEFVHTRKIPLETKFGMAQGGTLYIEEVGNLPILVQYYLMRAMDVASEGKDETESVRLVASSYEGLEKAVAERRFRGDLYRKFIRVNVPPLRERTEDVGVLASYFIHTQTRRLGRIRLAPEAVSAMMQYEWPGNVDELEYVIRKALVESGAMSHPSSHMMLGLEYFNFGTQTAQANGSRATLREERNDAERRALIEALSRHGGNISRAAKEIEVSRPTFHGLLDKHRLSAKDFK